MPVQSRIRQCGLCRLTGTTLYALALSTHFPRHYSYTSLSTHQESIVIVDTPGIGAGPRSASILNVTLASPTGSFTWSTAQTREAFSKAGWLSAVLKRIIYTQKVSKVMAAKSVETIKDELHQVKVQIEKLEQNAKYNINYLKFCITAESDLVSQKVVQFLQSRDLATRLFSWRADKFHNDNKKKVGWAILTLHLALRPSFMYPLSVFGK